MSIKLAILSRRHRKKLDKMSQVEILSDTININVFRNKIDFGVVNATIDDDKLKKMLMYVC